MRKVETGEIGQLQLGPSYQKERELDSFDKDSAKCRVF